VWGRGYVLKDPDSNAESAPAGAGASAALKVGAQAAVA
jgi:hypothetical protein